MTLIKQKSRGKPSKTPKGICRYCNEKISPENRLFQSGGGFKTECRPCRRKLSRENNRRKRQITKSNPLW
tara:strand:- start:975 stop:1184 length:210 start_codon:yes stop_codon:yes gene_type:complete